VRGIEKSRERESERAIKRERKRAREKERERTRKSERARRRKSKRERETVRERVCMFEKERGTKPISEPMEKIKLFYTTSHSSTPPPRSTVRDASNLL